MIQKVSVTSGTLLKAVFATPFIARPFPIQVAPEALSTFRMCKRKWYFGGRCGIKRASDSGYQGLSGRDIQRTSGIAGRTQPSPATT
jgi:hypothetical protein